MRSSEGLAMTGRCSTAAAAISAHAFYLLLLLLAFVPGLLTNVPATPQSQRPTAGSSPKNYSQEACAPKFWSQSRTHTACLVPQHQPAADLSRDDRRLIVDLHNKYRASVEQLPGQPSAADMQAMVWDDELAKLAAKWVSLCAFEHDRGVDRSIPGSYEVGQNLAMGPASWSQVVTRWWQEGAGFVYGSASAEGFGKQSTGHYVQIVWAVSSRVGCASTSCGAAGTLFACNYAHAVGVGSQRWIPYQRGAKGSACPSAYDATTGLCDCRGKICKNDGVLDLKTCQCRCSGRAPWLQPADCSVNCSLAEDRKVCATQGGAWDVRYCQSYGNVKYEYCPTMCGICPAKGSQPVPLALANNQAPPDAPTTESSEAEDEDGDDETEGEGEDTGTSEEAEEEEDEGEAIAEEDDSGTGSSDEDGGGGEQSEEDDDYEGDGLPRCTTVDDATCIQASHHQLSGGSAEQAVATTASATATAATDLSVLDRCRQPNNGCPAMCGQCLATMCKDVTGRPRFIGDTWLTTSGLYACSEQGVSVSRGCITANRVDVIPIGQQRNDTWNDIVYSCICNVVKNVLKLSCTPFGRAVATRDQPVPAPAVHSDDITARSVTADDFTDSKSVSDEPSTSDAPSTAVLSEERLSAAIISTSPLPSPPPPRCLHQDPPFCGSAVFARMAVHVRCIRGTRCPASCGHCLSSDTHPSYSAFLNELPAAALTTTTVTAAPAAPASRSRSQRTKQPHTTRSAPSTPPPSTAAPDEEAEAGADVADCAGPEPARCGQPSARGYFVQAQCRHMAVQQSCPAMCKLCKATACLDYSGRRYAVGEAWVSDFAQLLCTVTGVTAEKGCFFAQLRQFIAAGVTKNFTDGLLHFSCSCLVDDDQMTLDCTRTILVKGDAVQLPPATPQLPSSSSLLAASRLPHGTGHRPSTVAGQRALPVTAAAPAAATPQPRGRAAQSSLQVTSVSSATITAASSTSSTAWSRWHAHSTAAAPSPSPALLSSSQLPVEEPAASQMAASPDGSRKFGAVTAAMSRHATAVAADGAAALATTAMAEAATTVAAAPASGTPGSSAALPACTLAEEAKCGQPSSSGYYTASQCRHPTVLRLCPAMCGKCLAIACKDYSGRTYTTAQTWVSPGFGRMSCTEKGIAVEDGCYFKSRDAFVPTNKSYEYTEQSMVLSCLCERISATQLRMSCKTKT